MGGTANLLLPCLCLVSGIIRREPKGGGEAFYNVSYDCGSFELLGPRANIICVYFSLLKSPFSFTQQVSVENREE